MRTLIEGGTIVNEGRTFDGSVVVNEGYITEVVEGRNTRPQGTFDEVIDAEGKVRATSEFMAQTQLLNIPREATAAPELWRIRVVKMIEDYSIRLAAPIPPILYSSPLNVLE